MEFSRRATHQPVRAAFTLIELLVVIVMMAVLAAVLFPVFSTARVCKRPSACMSNMKQLGLAAMMYLQDYDETYNPVYRWTLSESDYETRRWWPEFLLPYARSSPIFRCPLDETKTAIRQIAAGSKVSATSYAMNGITSSADRWSHPESVDSEGRPFTAPYPKGFTGGFDKPVKLDDVKKPAETVVFVEVNLPSATSTQPEIWRDLQTDYAHTDPRIPPRHNGSFIIAYADGHVKWVKHGSTKAWQWTLQDD